MRLVSPPDDTVKYDYIKGPQHRWFFWAHAVAFIGIALSLYGFARMSYWTLVLLVPLIVYGLELIIGVRSSTFRRHVSLPDHQMTVEFYRPPAQPPSVDVFLPTAGEPVEILENTYGYVNGLAYAGPLKVYVLDDLGREEVRQAATARGFGYFARPGNAFKKAGNLQHAFERTNGDLIVIFDADFVPRPEFCSELVPYMDDESVGIVQTPQVFATPKDMHWLERGAGATQEVFYRFIQPSRDSVGGAICVGTSAVYRRKALEDIGGFPQISHSEDVYTGFEMAKAGYRLQYVPINLSQGICPGDIDSFISQQYRWCEGSMEMIRDPDFHIDPAMTIDQRVSFWSGFTYYASTAMNAFFAPIPALIMFWLFPQEVLVRNFIPLAGLAALWGLVYPGLLKSRWRLDVLRVQAIYSFTHAVAIYDVFFGKPSEWVPSNSKAGGSPTPLTTRVRKLMVGYIGVTQLAIFAGLAVHLVQYDKYTLSNWWAAVAFSIINGYVFLPVAWMSMRTFIAGRVTTRRHTAPVDLSEKSMV
jgi:cellulose synthase (UDP-forming)